MDFVGILRDFVAIFGVCGRKFTWEEGKIPRVTAGITAETRGRRGYRQGVWRVIRGEEGSFIIAYIEAEEEEGMEGDGGGYRGWRGFLW